MIPWQVGLETSLLGTWHDPKITERVTANHRLVVDYGCVRRLSSGYIVNEGNMLIECSLVYHPGYSVFDIADDDTVTVGL
jgi:hypothetical protein